MRSCGWGLARRSPRLAPRQSLCQHRIGLLVRAIVAQRRYDDAAGIERVDVAFGSLLARAAAKADPVIGEAARIGSRLDMHALDQADTLARQGERADLGSREVGEVDAEEVA